MGIIPILPIWRKDPSFLMSNRKFDLIAFDPGYLAFVITVPVRQSPLITSRYTQ